MERFAMCRVCLAENVRMYIVANRNLHELYEKLTDIAFVTEDRRPILACFFCYAKLKQCYRLLRQCLEAEELFAQRMNEDYEPKPLSSQDRLQLFSGFIKSPIEHINIVDECRAETFAVKQEILAVCDALTEDELELENVDNSCLDVANIPPHHSESDFEDDKPLMQLKTEVKDEEESQKKRRARDTRRATVARKPKLDTRRTKEIDAIPAEQTTKDKSDSKVIRTIQKRTSKASTYFKEPYKCNQRNSNRVKKEKKCNVCQRSYSHITALKHHIRIHTGEKPYKCDICQRSFTQKVTLKKHIRIHTGEKTFKCDVCQRSFIEKWNLNIHSRTHTGEKPYKCDLCWRSFSAKDTLTKHIRTHTGEKPYKCDVCQRSFNRKSSLSKHMRTHTDEKRHKCNVCQRRFIKKSKLTIHIRTHTGEKPYKCDICQCSFIQEVTLKKHSNTHR